MNKLKTLLIVTLAIGLVTVFAGSALADTFYVDADDGASGNSGTATDDAYADLYDAIDDAGNTSGSDTIYMDPANTNYTPESEYHKIDVADVTIIAKDFDGDETSADVVLDTEATDNSKSQVVNITADNVTMKSSEPSSYVFKLVASTAGTYTETEAPDYGVKIDTSSNFSADVSSISLSDFTVTGGDTNTGGTVSNAYIWKAALYVKTGSDYAVNSLTVDNWDVDDFDYTNAVAGLHLNEYGSAIDADIKKSAIGTGTVNTVGVLLNGDSTTSDFTGTKISKSKIKFSSGSATTGIELEGGLKGVTVERNYLFSGSAGSGTGVAVGDGDDDEADGITIQGNQIEDGNIGIEVDSTATSNLTATQNWINYSSASATVKFTSNIETDATVTYNHLTTDDDSIDVSGLSGATSSYVVDVSNNYYGSDDIADVGDVPSNNDYVTGLDTYLKAKDLSDVYVDDDYGIDSYSTDSNYLYRQSELPVSSTEDRAIYGYNYFAQIDSDTAADDVTALSNISPSTRSSHVTVHVSEATNDDYDGTGGTITLGNDYMKLVSEDGRDTHLKADVDVSADNVVIGATDKGFTIDKTSSNFDGSYPLIANTSGSFKLVDSKLTAKDGDGISSTGGKLTVEESDFEIISTGGDQWGIKTNRDGDLVVKNSDFNGTNSDYEFAIRDYNESGNPDATLEDNTFTNVDGVQITNMNSATVKNNEFSSIRDNEALLMTTESEDTTGTVSITKNTFSDTGQGVVLLEGINDTGKWTTSATVKVNENKFIKADQGYNVSNKPYYALLTGSGITGNSPRDADGDLTADVNAKFNYWGAASGPFVAGSNPDGEGGRVDEDVTYNPYWTKVSSFETIRGLDRPPTRSDEAESFFLISADSFYTHLYTLHLGREVV